MCNKNLTRRELFTTSLQNKDPEIFKNYMTSLRAKIDESKDTTLYTYDVNSMIILLNWCFKNKNNFFIDSDIRRGLVLSMIQTYNKIKSNVLCSNSHDVFDGLSLYQLKQLRFVLSRYVMVYSRLKEDDAHDDLVSVVNIDSIKRCITRVNNNMKNNNDETCPY